MDLFLMDPLQPPTSDPPAPAAAEPPAYTAHAANPSPSFAVNNHNHPPYAEMITAAITALKERNGSSRQAIAKYIEKNYLGLPPNHSALLTHHLKRLKNNGHLSMVKHSYKLPRSAAVAVSVSPSSITTTVTGGNGDGLSTGPKRGRGRPPKPKVDMDPLPNSTGAGAGAGPEAVLVSLGLSDGPDGPAPVARRGPGRPPKGKSGLVVVGAELGGPGVVGKRGRGRPARPKQLPVSMGPGGLVVGTEMGGPVVVKRGPGRPRRPKSLPVLMGLSGPKRRAGRPPRAGHVGSRPRGRPRKDGLVPVVKPAGRPRGQKKAMVAIPGGGGGGGAMVVAGGGVLPVKRRGRPPGAGGVKKKPRKLTGRPLGRPRKIASVTGIQAAATQQFVAYEDLKNKLSYFQSRIKHAVGTVKPHLNPETAMSAFGALQELDELATMDLNAPFNVQVHIQVQEPLLHN